MTYNSQELLNLFGRLFQQRAFMSAAIKSVQFGRSQDPQKNPNQLRVLHELAEKKALTNTDIVEALDIRPSSVSAMVSKLEAAGLIERHESPDDKRVMLISLTEKGQNMINDSRQFTDQLSESLFSSLTDDEQQQLCKLLGKLITDLEQKMPENWSEPKNFADFMRMAHDWHHNMDGLNRDFPFGGFNRNRD
ncbi:MarR family winged helix-turn-helix transcriptional regulator [Lentilactobacillus hilgardii]|uniref:Transcriptional regulator, MarR family n=1 Tax=Lentilactobacillus hilgardii (strain ATCC 8290 / DSM 20176 / CCUG 30140 / JCM 1155 / KCTC 3500 / NBRC 15886 / NCIMB 8040 / NRRL B-1843 / 9) TaxID=1423757 RepID=C0XJQ4_LENH9|nr:MarR family winged helix-turn-helix transcriptional regulator [Lentilactobacillus hilgardii]EEI20511.1 transcriptional regulator, MarR family [Lentilactobacillus buchneri ATCC 11577]EEI24383.1 transcriptional regulator, MarR family [Lentilactobacillus hilgardii DSM 20176 = ATCC 8290]MCP9333333.1 winged helix-turn-helix transcriptional regulator [Lentilactobacillus hilgardii]MCP9349942.1 winged helix-turn-helix transcriptional regulator [Lentilactobacillus hilgardii]MCP9352870.1 winged helix